MNIQQLINHRTSTITNKLAEHSAKQIHQSFDAEVTQQLADQWASDVNLSGQALNLSGYLATWRRRASATSTGLIVAGFLCLGLASGIKDAWYRLILSHVAIACWYGAKKQSKTVSETEPILGTLARIQAAQSAMQLTQLWEKQGRGDTIAQQQVTLIDQPLLAETVQLFDWNQLKDCDQYPHFLICGGTGSGKTYSTERIIKFLGGDATVITTKAKSDQWIGLPVIGKGRDFVAIERALHGALEEMQRRMQNLDNNWEPKIYVLDEFPSITANIESATEIITTLIREAREAKIRLFILSQGRQVKTLKLEGQSDLRENLSDILLGQFATDRAKELVGRRQANQALIDWCKSQQRPILVVDSAAVLPV